MKDARESEKGGEHGGLSSLGRRHGRPSSPEREETKKKAEGGGRHERVRRRRESGFYSKRGEGRVWFAELKGFSDDL